MWIQRDISPILAREAHEWPAVVVTGARQAGKTSLLLHAFPDHAYVSLDVPAVAEEAEEAGEQFLSARGSPLIIDEVQYAPQILRYIKAQIDKQPEKGGQYLITGSQKFDLMQGVTESLAGRASIIDCHSLSTEEIERFTGRAIEGDELLRAMYVGGYPKLHARGLDPSRYYANYVATYLERDVRQVLQVRNLRDFDRFLRLLALRNGQLVSAQALAAETGVSSGTIKSWLAVLEASNIVVLLPPYFRNLGKALVKTPKVYFLDTGLACFLAGLQSPAALRHSGMLGALFETFVAGQLLRFYARRGLAANLYFYRDHHGHEVDFVIPVGERLHLIECKWSEKPSLDVAGFEELRKRLGEDGILSRSLVTPRRGYYKTGRGIARGDCVEFPYLLDI